jgi:murein DD-endopeptidase MepM/ murein hydrolase activator NlpD
MPRNQYYYYDHESCAYVEVQPRKGQAVTRGSALLALALVLAGGLTLGLDRLTLTPQERALAAERDVLRDQLAMAHVSMGRFQTQLSDLAQADEQVYRSLLQAEPISDDTRQMGVGGVDEYAEFGRFETGDLLRSSAQMIETLERQIGLQRASYDDLIAQASERQTYYNELPVLKPTTGTIVSGFGMRRHPILRVRKMHAGLDIVARTGTPVYAAGNGIVSRVETSSTYGNLIEIVHAETGYKTLYAHLSAFAPGLKPGQRVERGAHIGDVGNTGRSTGSHLHYEVRRIDSDQAINPIELMAPSMTPQAYRQLLAESENAVSPLSLH